LNSGGDVSKSDRGGFILTQLDKDQFDSRMHYSKTITVPANIQFWKFGKLWNKVNTPTLGHLIIFYALKAKHRCILNLYKMNLFHSIFLVLVRVSLAGGIVSLNLTFKVYILNSSWIRGNKIILVFAYHPLFMIMIKSRVWGSHDLRKIIP